MDLERSTPKAVIRNTVDQFLRSEITLNQRINRCTHGSAIYFSFPSRKGGYTTKQADTCQGPTVQLTWFSARQPVLRQVDSLVLLLALWRRYHIRHIFACPYP